MSGLERIGVPTARHFILTILETIGERAGDGKGKSR
jgi:hypothetical protein